MTRAQQRNAITTTVFFTLKLEQFKMCCECEFNDHYIFAKSVLLLDVHQPPKKETTKVGVSKDQ